LRRRDEGLQEGHHRRMTQLFSSDGPCFHQDYGHGIRSHERL
jgi:hypothetical protein